MVRTKQKRTEHGAVIKVATYPQHSFDAQNMWHVLLALLILVIVGVLLLFVIKVALTLIVIGGAVYLLYLMVHRKRKA